MSTDHSANNPSATATQLPSDPTLAAPASDAGGEFPDTAVGTHLVLYQTEDGAVDLRWHIDPADIAHARAGFGNHPAHPVLRLHRVGSHGDDQLMADADLGADADAEDGHAHYAGGNAVGLLQAEIGLAGDDGGWLLIARSNGLPAAAPVGARFLKPGRSPTPPEATAAAAPAPAGSSDGSSAAASSAAFSEDAAAGDGDEAAPPPLPLAPEFPLVEPPLSARARAASQAPATQPEPEPDAGVGVTEPAAAEARAPHRAAADNPALRSGSDPSLGRAAPVTQLPGPGAGLPGTLRGPEPPPGGVVPRLTPRPPPQATAPPTAAPAEPVAGSGPLRPQVDGATLAAELVVHGTAPPNTLLDLGGHPYRVGPGGRFVLHIPIGDHQVIMRLLAALPQLPVAPRDDGMT
ncbi:hypothetical protein [uncultured Thiohalocapsa sp.]|uniref:hypothetical protein n=1 Tax=uncultured Thiohalocapsa sp. TaxID=768990 RepID=UPI0025DCFA35|nr:hypothetical protein [uncultured Thiohalocapsa sp.]